MNAKRLKRIIQEEIKKLKGKRSILKENKIEWWCDCTNGGCFGTIDFQDQSADCSCCDEDCENIRKDVDRGRSNTGGIKKPPFGSETGPTSGDRPPMG